MKTKKKKVCGGSLGRGSFAFASCVAGFARRSSLWRAKAGVTQWQCACFPSKIREFDSRHPLKSFARQNFYRRDWKSAS